MDRSRRNSIFNTNINMSSVVTRACGGGGGGGGGGEGSGGRGGDGRQRFSTCLARQVIYSTRMAYRYVQCEVLTRG